MRNVPAVLTVMVPTACASITVPPVAPDRLTSSVSSGSASLSEQMGTFIVLTCSPVAKAT
jgi:hypothetical protein